MVRKNIISNIAGKGLSAILSFVFVPFYLKYLGAEAYGLIGFYVLLQSVFMVADMGLSGAFSRETARLTALPDMKQQLNDLCRTFEFVFAGIGIAIGLIIIALSHPLAVYWMNPNTLSLDTVVNTILLIGVVAGLQFPFIIYQGGMLGLQCHTPLNILLVFVGLLRGLGALWILAMITPTIEAYFLWQIFVSIVQVVVGRIFIWRKLPKITVPARFKPRLIYPLWHFAAGMAGITFTGILLMQADKLILSKILALEDFGYYTLATVVAGIPSIIAYPVFNAAYPRFTQLVALQKIDELNKIYHEVCQVMAVLLLPLGLLVAFFSKEILFLWTGDLVTTQNTFPLVRVLVIGSTLMGLMIIPYALQLSFAWTRIALHFNIMALCVLIPILYWGVSTYGAIAACYAWVGLYLGQILIIIHFMHRKILTSEKWGWYLEDVFLPLLSPLVIMIIGKLIISASMSSLLLIAYLGLLFLAATCGSALSASKVRKEILTRVKVLYTWR